MVYSKNYILILILLMLVPWIFATPYSDAVLADSPDLYLRFEESSGAVADNSGSSSVPDGTYNNINSLNYAQQSANSNLGNAIQIDSYNGEAISSSNSHISVDGASTDFRDQITIEFWLKLDSFTNYWSPIIFKGTTAGSPQRTYTIWLYHSGYLAIGTSDGSQEVLSTPADSIQIGNWYHYMAVIDRISGNMAYYLRDINGNLTTNTSSLSTNLAVSSSEYSLKIGSGHEVSSSYSPMDGFLDEVAIYNKALTANDALEHFTAATTNIPEPNIITFFILSIGGFFIFNKKK